MEKMQRNNSNNKINRPPEGRYIMGKNCIEEVIKFSPKRVKKIFFVNEDYELMKKIENLRIPYQTISKVEMTRLVNSESHQSIVALVSERVFPDFTDYLNLSWEKDNDLILVLDSINDPQNLGTLLRCAECFGAGAVLWSKNRGSDITPVVSKASVGASELVTIIKVSNLVESVKKAKTEGYVVITAEVGDNTIAIDTFDFPKKTVLIMGSEGEGVRQLLSKQADYKIYIPMQGAIDSLNVSQATTVFLYQWRNSIEQI